MPEQLYEIRLPDGQVVSWNAKQIAEYEGDWQILLSTMQVEQLHKVIQDDEPYGKDEVKGEQ